MSASQELYIKTKYVFFLLYLSGVIILPIQILYSESY